MSNDVDALVALLLFAKLGSIGLWLVSALCRSCAARQPRGGGRRRRRR